MGHRWRGYEHPELYNMINSGPGAAASDPQTSYWEGLAKELSQLDQDLNTKLTHLGSRWEGQASESAQSGLTPLASWATDAQTGADVMKVSSEDQGQFVSDARSNMPEPLEVTTPAPSGWDYAKAVGAASLGFGGPAVDVAQQAEDHEAQEAAKNAAEEKAVQTMQTYESSSTWNRSTLGTFVPPPDVVVSTPAPQGGSTVGVVGPTRGVKNVANNGTDSGTTGGSSIPGGTHGTSDVPSTHDQQHGSTGDNGGGGGGGGGSTTKPPTVNNPGATNPSDVFVPPPGGGNPLPPAPPGGGGPVPTPSPGPPNLLPPGGGPFPSLGGGGENAGDIARRAMPLRTGLPVEGGPFGRGGLPGGGPGANGLGALEGERVPSQLGRGGVLGGGPGEGGVVRSGPGAAGAAGRGGNGVNGPAGTGRRAEDEEEQEHYAPDYLLESDDVFGDERRVAPTVIGE